MRWIVGDIHGHLAQLDHVLGKIRALDADAVIYSVGDVVDRGPDDRGVVERLIEHKVQVVRGNHDAKYAKSHAAFFASLPERIDAGDFAVVHEPPDSAIMPTYCGHATGSRVTITGNVINVDTGMGKGGKLSAICHETRRVVSSDAAIAAPRPGAVPLTIGRVAHGLTGIGKAVTGTGGASGALVKERTAICASCPHAKLTAGVLKRCKLCGCSTWAKIRNASEACPDGRWPTADSRATA